MNRVTQEHNNMMEIAGKPTYAQLEKSHADMLAALKDLLAYPGLSNAVGASAFLNAKAVVAKAEVAA